ncbi:MAG TPA: ABC transporter ATP-binding protein, partial [Thermoanaerobaculia bacterium]|nr:ABC transporter ATP-binding protein [Thermoanaerobaculia bacterium]
GDSSFTDKCEARINRFHEAGTTVLLVSHNADAIRKNCTRCLWLDAGRLRADGGTEEVLDRYLHAGTEPDERPSGQLHLT